MANLRRRSALDNALGQLGIAASVLVLIAAGTHGQGFDILGEAPVTATPPPPPPMRISEVAKQRTFEDHVGSHLHHGANASAPVPAPAAGPVSAPSGAPEPGQTSPLDLLSPLRSIGGVAQPGMGPPAPAPLPLPRSSAMGPRAQAPQASNASAPLASNSSSSSSSGSDWGGLLSAVSIYSPPAPVPIITPDGDIVYPGPTYSSSAGTKSTFDQYFWPTVSLLGLIAIVASLIWAFSKRRTARRYIDLKDTEMAMQQRETRPPHATA